VVFRSIANGTEQVSSSVLYEKFRVLTHRKEKEDIMKFIKQLNRAEDAQPPVGKPIPMRPKTLALPDDREQLTDLIGVARKLGVSKRFVQELVKNKTIPVIRLGRRCVRFDPDAVLTAVKRFEVKEVQL
jgi:excisionase family DNA binding protein